MSWLKRKLPQKRWRRVLIYFTSTLMLLLAADMLLVQYLRIVTISPETTRITTPLNKAGYPDYVAAIDEMCRVGVTPENNAAAILVAGYARNEVPEPWAKAVLPKLGIAALRDTPLARRWSDYVDRLVGSKTQPRERQSLWDEEDLMANQPWTSAQRPDWAAYLQANEAAITAVREAAKRDRYYVPWATGRSEAQTGDVLAVPLPSLGHVSPWTDLLRASAMHHLGEGRIAECHADVIACMRIARLIEQGPTLIDGLNAISIDIRALACMQAMALSGALNPDELERLQKDLTALPALRSPADSLDHYARFFILDSLCLAAKDGVMTVLDTHSPRDAEERLPFSTPINLLLPFHADAALRRANHYFDAYSAAMRIEDYAAATKALDQVTKDFFDAPRGISATADRMLLSVLLPSFSLVRIRYETCLVQRELTLLALQLAIQHAPSHAYPATLPNLPRDRFSPAGNPYIYKPRAAGYLLYSVGPDGLDNAGTPRDPKHPQPPYDIVIKTDH